MGNILCKERHQPRRKYVKSPIDQVIHSPVNSGGQYEQNVYPNSINHINSTDKMGTNQKYFSSVPNLNGGTTLNQSSILIPDPSIFDDGKHPPIVPPRRKKMQKKAGTLPANLPTTTTRVTCHKDGFKDIFCSDIRSSSCENFDAVDHEKVQTRATSCIDINSRKNECKKMMRVGNRKSDQLLGENLSDSLSDEPYFHNATLEMDEVARKKISTTPKIVAATEKVKVPSSPDNDEKLSQSLSTSLDKKAEFLMAMLDADDDERYKDKAPVEEPIFIAKKKVIKKHICDDEDHMRHCLHRHEKETEEKNAKIMHEVKTIEATEKNPKIVHEVKTSEETEKIESGTQTIAKMRPIQVEAAIELPKRHAEKRISLDMSLSEDSIEQIKVPAHFEQGPKKPERDFSKYQKIENQEVERPIRFKKLSRENLPSPPATPPKKNGCFDQLISPDVPPRRLVSQNSEPVQKSPPALVTQLSDSAIFDKKIRLSPIPRTRVRSSDFKTSTPISDIRTRKISAPQGPKEIAEAMKNPRLPYTSTSAMANNLMDSLMKKAYGYQQFSPEDNLHAVHDVTITPTSKLQIRKISTPIRMSASSSPAGSRAESPRPSSVTEILTSNEEMFPPPRKHKLSFEDKLNESFDENGIDTVELEKLMKKIEPKVEERPKEKKLEHIKEEKLKEKMEQRKEAGMKNPQLAIPKLSRDEILHSPALAKSMDEIVSPTKLCNPLNDIIDEIYSKNSDIMMEFQAFLEKNLESDPKLDATIEKAYVEVETVGITSSTPEPSAASKIVNEKIKNPDSDNESNNSQTYSDSFESSEEEDTIDKELKIVNKNLKLRGAGGRRESIEDVDNWFNNYTGASESVLHGKLSNNPGSPNYEAKQMYPFGRFDARRGSLSDEFFDCSIPLGSCSKTTPDRDEIKAHAKQLREAMHSKNLVRKDGEFDDLIEPKRPAKDIKKSEEKKPKEEPIKKVSVASGILISWPQESERSQNESTNSNDVASKTDSKKDTSDSNPNDHSLLLKYFDTDNEILK